MLAGKMPLGRLIAPELSEITVYPRELVVVTSPRMEDEESDIEEFVVDIPLEEPVPGPIAPLLVRGMLAGGMKVIA